MAILKSVVRPVYAPWFESNDTFSHKVDTARTYAGGTSEKLLGRIDWAAKGLKLETKLSPNAVNSSQQLC